MGSSLPLTSTDSGTLMPIESGEESISSMQLTKLRAAPERQAEVPPCAPAGKAAGGGASQLVPLVGGPDVSVGTRGGSTREIDRNGISCGGRYG